MRLQHGVDSAVSAVTRSGFSRREYPGFVTVDGDHFRFVDGNPQLDLEKEFGEYSKEILYFVNCKCCKLMSYNYKNYLIEIKRSEFSFFNPSLLLSLTYIDNFL